MSDLNASTEFYRAAPARGQGVSSVLMARRSEQQPVRERNKLSATRAQTVIAAAILRHLHAVITTGKAWDPIIATHGTRRDTPPIAA